MSWDNPEENPRSKETRETIILRNQEDNITQVIEENEGRVTKKLSQEYSRSVGRRTAFTRSVFSDPRSPSSLGANSEDIP